MHIPRRRRRRRLERVCCCIARRSPLCFTSTRLKKYKQAPLGLASISFLANVKRQRKSGRERESRPRNDDGGNPFYLRMTSQGRPPRCRERKRETALQVLAAVSLVALLPNRRAHSMIDFAFNVNSCREKSVGHPLMQAYILSSLKAASFLKYIFCCQYCKLVVQ